MTQRNIPFSLVLVIITVIFSLLFSFSIEFTYVSFIMRNFVEVNFVVTQSFTDYCIAISVTIIISHHVIQYYSHLMIDWIISSQSLSLEHHSAISIVTINADSTHFFDFNG